MNYKGRIRLLLSVNTYRTRLAFFVVLGGAVFIASFLVADTVLRDILRQFALTFIAVGAVDFVWDILGGDPLELQMTRDFGEVDAKIESIQRSMAVLSDIVDGNIGIERIWIDRLAWEQDSTAGLASWKTRVCQARSVDIVSNTLWTRWFHDEIFLNDFFANLTHGATARILVYDPRSDVLKLRAFDERSLGEGKGMRTDIERTLDKIIQHRSALDEAAKKNLQVRLTSKHYHLAQIIRADDKMLVAIYLTHETGAASPTLQLSGAGTVYFAKYVEQINELWKEAGQDLSDDGIQQVLVELNNR